MLARKGACMSLAIIPNDLKPIILHFLDHKGICRMQSVSKEWCTYASADKLWLDLFHAIYPKEPLPIPGQAKNKFKERILSIPIKDESHLEKAITSFFLKLKWNKKRGFTCFFPNDPSYSLNLAQSFGPERGTKAGFEGPADETEYYEFTGSISSGQPASKNYNTQAHLQCPPQSFYDSLSQQIGIPLTFSNIYSTAFDTSEDWYSLRLYVTERFVNGKVEGVDVGFGNTLGYFSQINDWKSPFELFCLTEPSTGKPIWVGLIPIHAEFKFVSINSEGAVTWEKKPSNRVLRPHPRYDTLGHVDLRENIHNYPIGF